jgi:hypothetical protein
MWGITEGNPYRSRLTGGDKVLIYVGAPEQSVIARATLGSEWHPWTEEEAQRYPGSFGAGVVFSEAESFARAVPLRSLVTELSFSESNPRLMFRSGVVRIEQGDYEAVVLAASRDATAPSPVPPPGTTTTPITTATATGGDVAPVADRLFEETERLRDYLSQPRPPLSEEGTRARLIDRVIDALGYTGWDEVEHGTAVASGDFPDYVLRVGETRVVAVEAKRLGHPMRAREAAQLVQYCTTLGVRWGVLTDGRIWKLYDGPVLNVEPEDRLVIEVDLSDYQDREEFETRIYPDIALLAKSEMETGAALARRAAQESIRELLTTNSGTVDAIQRELEATKRVRMSHEEIIELTSELLG